MDIDSVLKSHGVGASGSNIKKIQKGVTTPDKSGELLVAISSVNLEKSIVRAEMRYRTSGYGFYNISLTAGVYFKDDKTIVIHTNGFKDPDVIVYWEVIEFNNVKSVQRGSTNRGGSSIAKVDVNKSLVFHSHTYEEVSNPESFSGELLSSNTMNSMVTSQISNGTYLTFYDTKATYDPYKIIYWNVVEFN